MVVLVCSIYLAIDKTVEYRLAVNRFRWGTGETMPRGEWEKGALAREKKEDGI
jgi:hypothetical protein